VHFVVLVNLTPYVFNLSLYSSGSDKYAPSRYFIDPVRFEYINADLVENYLQSPPNDDPEIVLLDSTSTPLTNEAALEICTETVLSDYYHLVQVRTQRDLPSRCLAFLDAQNRQQSRLVKEQYLSSKPSSEQARELLDAFAIASTEWLNQAADPTALEALQVSAYAPEYYHGLLANFSAQQSSQNDIEQTNPYSAYQLMQFPSWILGLILILPAITICLVNRMWFMAVLLFAIPLYNYATYILSMFSEFERGARIISVAAVQLSSIWLIATCKLRSRAFFLFLIVAFMGIYFPYFAADSFDIIDSQYLDYSITQSTISLLIFVTLFCIGRLFVKGARQNFALLKGFGWLNNTKLVARSLFLWLPMAVLCLPFFYFSYYAIPKAVSNNLHSNHILLYDYQSNDDLLNNSLQSSAYHFDQVRLFWFVYTERLKEELKSSGKSLQEIDLARSVEQYFDAVFPRELQFKVKKSNRRFVIGTVINEVNKQTHASLQRSYRTLRTQIKNNLTRIATEHQGSFENFAGEVVDKGVNDIKAFYVSGKSNISAQEGNLQASLNALFSTLFVYHLFMTILFVYVCIKSYLYVFSRVSFHPKTGIEVTLGSETEKANEERGGTISALGSQFELKTDTHSRYYISRRFQCRGAPPNLKFVQMLSAPFSRLLNGVLGLNEIDVYAHSPNISCSSTQGVEYFEWSLGEDEKVLFDLKHFVGMTDTVRLSTLVSPKISSLLLGKIIYTQATGPGKLLLLAKGRAEISVGQSTIQSLPPERVIAMSLETRMHVDSQLDMLNIYFSNAYIKPLKGKMLIDVDTQGGTKSGSAAFIRHFLLPG
jgi:hypothetical protein